MPIPAMAPFTMARNSLSGELIAIGLFLAYADCTGPQELSKGTHVFIHRAAKDCVTHLKTILRPKGNKLVKGLKVTGRSLAAAMDWPSPSPSPWLWISVGPGIRPGPGSGPGFALALALALDLPWP